MTTTQNLRPSQSQSQSQSSRIMCSALTNIMRHIDAASQPLCHCTRVTDSLFEALTLMNKYEHVPGFIPDNIEEKYLLSVIQFTEDVVMPKTRNGRIMRYMKRYYSPSCNPLPVSVMICKDYLRKRKQ